MKTVYLISDERLSSDNFILSGPELDEMLNHFDNEDPEYSVSIREVMIEGKAFKNIARFEVGRFTESYSRNYRKFANYYDIKSGKFVGEKMLQR